MSSSPVAERPEDGARHYTFLALTALGVASLALFLRSKDVTSVLPVVVGALALAFRWRSGVLLGGLLMVVWLLAARRWAGLHPAFVIQSISYQLRSFFYIDLPTFRYIRPTFIQDSDRIDWTDLLLVAAMLVYVPAHYRYLSLAARIFPGDSRRRGRTAPDSRLEQRGTEQVAGREVLHLVFAQAIWLGLAWLCWQWLSRKRTDLDLDDGSWQAIVLIWLLGTMFLLASALVRYARQGRQRPEEAQLVLQDALWIETSREQRRVNRWLAWARRRKERT